MKPGIDPVIYDEAEDETVGNKFGQVSTNMTQAYALSR